MNKVQLGDKVKDRYTGFIGTVVSKTEFVNGCIQCGIVAKMKSKDQVPAELDIDEQSLEVITPKKKPVVKKETNGGPTRMATKMKGF